MRILYVGAIDFSRHCLQEVLKAGGDVVAILTLPKEKAGSHSDYADPSTVAAQHGITVHRIGNINAPQNVDLIWALAPDVIFVFGWSQIISKEVLDIPTLGCVGTHPALLPRNRGRHPLVWALIEGLEESGLTFFYLDEGADSGDILWQKPFPITLEDDAGSLHEKIKSLASEAIPVFLTQLERGTAPRIPQDHNRATYWRKRGEEDGEIDWKAPTIKTYNLVRALTHPYVGAHTYEEGRRVKIWGGSLPRGPLPPHASTLEPGTVFLSAYGRLDIRTGDGYLTVGDYRLEGGGTIAEGTRLGAEG